eukprot:4881579-Prymnesium_polylepis.2
MQVSPGEPCALLPHRPIPRAVELLLPLTLVGAEVIRCECMGRLFDLSVKRLLPRRVEQIDAHPLERVTSVVRQPGANRGKVVKPPVAHHRGVVIAASTHR